MSDTIRLVFGAAMMIVGVALLSSLAWSSRYLAPLFDGGGPGGLEPGRAVLPCKDSDKWKRRHAYETLTRFSEIRDEVDGELHRWRTSGFIDPISPHLYGAALQRLKDEAIAARAFIDAARNPCEKEAGF